MEHGTRIEAKKIAGKLMQELRDGKRTKVGIDEIRTAIRDAGYDNGDETFEELVTRAVVEDVP